MASPTSNQRMAPRIIGLFRPYWPRVTAVGLLILLTAGFGALNPVLIKYVFDSALFPEIGPPDLTLLWMLCAAMAVITVGSAALGVFQTYMTNNIGQDVMGDLQDAVYTHLQGMSLRFFTRTRTGELQSSVSNDVSGIHSVVTNTITDTISNAVIFLSAVIAMVVLSWQFTVVAVAIVPPLLSVDPMGGTVAARGDGRCPAVHGPSYGSDPGNPLPIRHHAG